MVTPQMPSYPALVRQPREGQRGGRRSGSRQRREALTGYVRRALWGGDRPSPLPQPHLGPMAKSRVLGRDAGLILLDTGRPGRGLPALSREAI